MLRAISPGNNAYSFKNLFQKKKQIIPKSNQKEYILPNIKQTKDKTTSTEEIKTNLNNSQIFISPDLKIYKNKFIFNGIINNQMIKCYESLNKNNQMENNILNDNKFNTININNKSRNSKTYFNKNFKLKSIEKTMIKSNSCVNIINSDKTLTIINMPSNNINKGINYNMNKKLKRLSSLPKMNFDKKNIEFKDNEIENDKCNYLYLKFNGIDNSKKSFKKRRFMLINSHKVIESLQTISMPEDNYGKKLIDILENRINSGYYRKLNYNFSNNSNNLNSYDNYFQNYNIDNNSKDIIENKNKRFNCTSLSDVFDDFLLPDKENKYNYIIHKIFLGNILNKICKKMIEIRDIKNRLITKKEIREEYCNQLNKLRDHLYKDQKYNIINHNIFNMNNNTNIININLSNNNSIINEISTIEELQESLNINNEKDKQIISGKLFNINDKNLIKDNSNNFINIENNENKFDIEEMHSKYKIVSKNENKEILSLFKNKLNLKNKNISLHDFCSNLYVNKINKGAKTSNTQFNRFKHIMKKNLYKKNYIPYLTENYYSQEENLNNVNKFLLKTKKLKYTFDIYEKTPRNRNYSFDLEGNAHHTFDVGPKLNYYNFEDIFNDIEKEYNKINSNDKTLKEFLKFFLENKNNINKFKFNDEITRKFISFIFTKKTVQNNLKKRKKKKSNKIIIKEQKNIIEDIGKKIHKSIKIIIGGIKNSEDKKIKQKKHYNSEDNVKNRRRKYCLSEITNMEKININERVYTDNIYIEIETNSSEYSDIPSELDSEIEEMIRIKREKEKEEEEQGIYSQKKDKERIGGDFIIENPKDKIQNLKKNMNNKKDVKNQIKNEYISMINENGNIKNINLISNIDKYLKINENGVIDNAKGFKGNKNLIHKNTKTGISTKIINSNTNKNGIIDMKVNIDNDVKNINKSLFKKNENYKKNNNNSNEKSSIENKKENKNIDIKEFVEPKIIKKNNLEKISEEESKDNKMINKRKNIEKKEIPKKKNSIKYNNINRKNIKTKTINEKNDELTSTHDPNSLNNDLTLNNKTISSKYNNEMENKSKEIVNDYNDDENKNKEIKKENIKQDNNNESENRKEDKENKKNYIQKINKKTKRKNKDNNKNKKNENRDIEKNINNISNDDKIKINKENIEDKESEEEEDEDEDENDDEEIQESYNSFSHINLSTLSDKEKIYNKTISYFYNNIFKNFSFYKKERNDEIYNNKETKKKNEIGKNKKQSKSYNKNKNKDNIKKKRKKNKENEKNNTKNNIKKNKRKSINMKNEYNKEDGKNRKRLKRNDKKVKIRGIEKLFKEDNDNKDENEEEEYEEELEEEYEEEIPKKKGWEEKFNLFKQYIKKLKDMNDAQFNTDAIKFLKEDEKEDLSRIEKLNKVERINKFKAFLSQTKKKRINYNKFYSSHVIFTPGCIFSTGELCK